MRKSLFKITLLLVISTIFSSCSSNDDGEDLLKEVFDIAGYTFPGHKNGDGYCNQGDTFGGKASFIFGKDNSLSVSYGVYMSLESKLLEQLDKRDVETNKLSNIRKEVVIDSEGKASYVIYADWSIRTFICSFFQPSANDSTYFLNLKVIWNDHANAGIITSRLTKEQVAKLKKLFTVAPDSKDYKEALKKKGLGIKTAFINVVSTESLEDQLDKLSHPLDFEDLKFELKGNQKQVDFETLNKNLLASIQAYFASLKPNEMQKIEELQLWDGSELKISDYYVPVVKFKSFEKQEFELYTANGFSLQEIKGLNSDFFTLFTTVIKPAVAKWFKENKPQPSEDLDSKEFLFKLTPRQSDTFILLYPDSSEPSYTPPISTDAPPTPKEDSAPTVPRGAYSISDPDGYTNLRATPGGKVIRKVYENETFDVIETGDSYSKIKLNDGTVGYMHKSRIKSAN